MVLISEEGIEQTIAGIVIVIILYNNAIQFATDISGNLNILRLGLILAIAVGLVMKSKFMKKIAYG